MGDFNDHIKNTFDGEEIPFNPEHWEQMKDRLNQSPAPTSFEEGAKNIFESASVPMAAGAWDQFSQKLNEAQSTPFEKGIQDKFAEAEVPYNESHWENISSKINQPSSAFERKAKDILSSKEVAYNAKHWGQMEAMLDGAGQKTTGAFGWRAVAASAALILLGWLTYAALNNNHSGENQTADNSSSVSDKKEGALSASAEKELSSAAATEEKNKASVSEASSAREEKTILPSDKSQTNAVYSSVNKNSTQPKKYKRKNASSAAFTNAATNTENTPADNNNNEGLNTAENTTAQNSPISEAHFLFNEIALADKNISRESEDDFDTLATQAVEADWSGMIFKYATLPSSLPSSVLANVWEQPAIAGIDKHTAVKFMYNSPWENKVVDQNTGKKEFHLQEPANMYLSVDAAPLSKTGNLGIGGYYYRIHNNDWQSDNINLTLSYTHQINKFTQVRGGVGATYSNNALNTSNLNFWQKTSDGAMLVANDASVNNPERYINYKAGVWLSHPLVFAGLTVDNLFQTTITKRSDLQLSSSAIAGVNIPFTKKFTTTAYVKRVAVINALYTVGAMFSYNNKVFAGVSYENSNYATMTIGCNIKNQLRLHMSMGIMASRESWYINDTNNGFVTAGIRYLIEPSRKKSSEASL